MQAPCRDKAELAATRGVLCLFTAQPHCTLHPTLQCAAYSLLHSAHCAATCGVLLLLKTFCFSKLLLLENVAAQNFLLLKTF